MGGNLKIFLAFAVLGIALAKVTIEGEYNSGVIKVNFTWNIENPPHAEKLQIFRNDVKITCIEGVSTANPHPEEVNCTCSKLSEKKGTCNITANAPANASDELFVAISCLAETCTPEIAEVNVYAPATQVNKIKTSKTDSGDHEAECIFRGVPAPQITWKIIKDNELKQVSGKIIKTVSTWEPSSNLWKTRSILKMATEKKTVMCFAQQKMKNGNLLAALSDAAPINSAETIGTPGIYVVLSLVYAFISKSIV